MRNRPIIPALTVALLISIGACEPDNITETTRDAARAPSNPEAGFELTSEQITEAQRRVVASLPVDELGRIDIVDAGADGTPWYVYVSVGRPAVHDVLDELGEQSATPAEVFLALAPRAQTIPDVLLRDHEARAGRGEANSHAPRRLESPILRVAANHVPWQSETEQVDRGCYSGQGIEPQSFASWIDDFWSWSSTHVFTDYGEDSTTDATKQYLLFARSARAMSACDASYGPSGSQNLSVMFAGYFPNQHPVNDLPTLFYVASDLGEFDSVRHKSYGGPFYWYRMYISQSFPQEHRAYVAYGNCSVFPCG